MVSSAIIDATDPAASGEGSPGSASASPGRGFADAWDRFARHRLAVFSLFLLLLIITCTLVVPAVSPYKFDAQDLSNASLPPTVEGWHLFGTDELGRDYLIRVLVGAQTSLLTAAVAASVALIVGTVVGTLAGFYSRVDNVLMRMTDLFILLPGLAVLLILVDFLGRGSSVRVGLILGLLMWPVIARVIRASTLSVRELGYVEAARASGLPGGQIITRHVIPNLVGPLAVNGTLTVASAILVEATLAFLGVGVQPPQPALGRLISDGQGLMFDQWWLVFFPGMFILIVCLAINFIGDGLRDAIS